MKFNKLAFALIGAASLVTAVPAAAAFLPDFTINATSFGGGNFTADKITGNYSEVATFGPGNAMSVSLKWDAGQFVTNDGVTAINAGTTGLGVTYNLYALFQGIGTYTTVGANSTFTLSSGSTTLWLDKLANTTVVAEPIVGTGTFTLGNAADDTLLASGVAVDGGGNVACSFGLNCGSFGQTTTLALQPGDGTTFFAAPNPFYGITLQAGQLNGFAPAGTLRLNGSLDVVFAPTPVPEPGSLALVGLALAGLSVLRRNKKA